MVMFETSRLILRQPTEDDLDPLAAVNADPRVMRFIGNGTVRSRQQTADGLARARQEWDERGHGMFSVVIRESGRFAGWVALTEPAFLPEILPAVEIGWRLGHEFWGRGYATEAARVALRFGFTSCGLERIVSIRHVDNDASKRVMDKLGMTFDRETVVPAYGRPVAVHAIDRGDFDAMAASF
ncbi:N-acetyltransferase [Planotetraspora thailandica]|uniref:N-acetyltransferase n=1 Tax=Planotetraspora thailandica TaxID=487172 RepID=A0A8J3Y2U8_9ACTN|nr:GNAT family N-acetyltransferase [Planotetraspora thailandica]GII59900.1 N-acetyltransferase [Planotetraspora thailandica]